MGFLLREREDLNSLDGWGCVLCELGIMNMKSNI